MTTENSRADALTEAQRKALETAVNVLNINWEHETANELWEAFTAPSSQPAAAPIDPTDPGYDVETLREHVRHLERRLRQLSAPAPSPADERAATDVPECNGSHDERQIAAGDKECTACAGEGALPVLLTAQDLLMAIDTFEIVGENNDSREPNAEDRFILTEFIAHASRGFIVEPRQLCYQCNGCGDNDAAPGWCVRCNGAGIEPDDQARAASASETGAEGARLSDLQRNAVTLLTAPALPDWFDEFIRNVCELPDRNSPEDWPEAIVATPEELRECALNAVSNAPVDESASCAVEAAALRAYDHAIKDGFSRDLESYCAGYIDRHHESHSPAMASEAVFGYLRPGTYENTDHPAIVWRDGLKDATVPVYLAAPQPAQADARVGLTDEQWYDLASRHANADWNGNGYLASVKALCGDYRTLLATPQPEPRAEVTSALDAYKVAPVTLLEQQKRSIAERHFQGAPDVCRALKCIDEACAEMLTAARTGASS